jgi:hypothetical protein
MTRRIGSGSLLGGQAPSRPTPPPFGGRLRRRREASNHPGRLRRSIESERAPFSGKSLHADANGGCFPLRGKRGATLQIDSVSERSEDVRNFLSSLRGTHSVEGNRPTESESGLSEP